ncbi:hypothetical protein BDN70DRAFT_937210 [Pholiota conissans]|uniref:Uncharacterized protein n=1 Tax=Pholiota conissans TaxID=109636 RepID=A0A9P5YS50_9AGAR|nr:hypothetical protein BDN70DRAFT_937210 [Pholiota conissans]
MMKESWKHKIDKFEELHMHGVNKEDLCGVFGYTFLTAFTPKNIKSAFAARGIHSFNNTIITPEQMESSKAMSTKALFLLTQSSPIYVYTTLIAIENHKFMHQELHPNTLTPSSPQLQEIPIDSALILTLHTPK